MLKIALDGNIAFGPKIMYTLLEVIKSDASRTVVNGRLIRRTMHSLTTRSASRVGRWNSCNTCIYVQMIGVERTKICTQLDAISFKTRRIHGKANSSVGPK